MHEPFGIQSAEPVEGPAARARPRLVYDRNCGFSFSWARYWQKLTGDTVEYGLDQQVLPQYPTVAEAEFQRAVQFIAPDDRRASGAEASLLTLAHARGKGFWPRLDWQMWFAALDDPQRALWFSRFLERLLENEPFVTGLLERNPLSRQAADLCAGGVVHGHLRRS